MLFLVSSCLHPLLSAGAGPGDRATLLGHRTRFLIFAGFGVVIATFVLPTVDDAVYHPCVIYHPPTIIPPTLLYLKLFCVYILFPGERSVPPPLQPCGRCPARNYRNQTMTPGRWGGHGWIPFKNETANAFTADSGRPSTQVRECRSTWRPA